MLKGTGSSDDMISGTGSSLIVLGIAAISKRSEVLLDCCSKYDDTKSVVLNPAVGSAETPPEAVPLEETFLEMLVVRIGLLGAFLLEEVWLKNYHLEDLKKLVVCTKVIKRHFLRVESMEKSPDFFRLALQLVQLRSRRSGGRSRSPRRMGGGG